MALERYPNNEDIILSRKRLSPETQRMSDPNESKAKYHYKDGKWGRGNGNKRIASMLLGEDDDLFESSGKSISQKQEEKRFMDMLYNSCQRCGKDISSYKTIHPKHYTYGLCLKCNEIVSGKKERIIKTLG